MFSLKNSIMHSIKAFGEDVFVLLSEPKPAFDPYSSPLWWCGQQANTCKTCSEIRTECLSPHSEIRRGLSTGPSSPQGLERSLASLSRFRANRRSERF